ncbi:MAG: hypothetical protein K6E74_02050 [Bacilli bacterium]|nr:hypothetical protein [Bacilli bacterium]
MYETLKIKLIFMVINGCKFGQWHMFNNWCKEKLTSREYASKKGSFIQSFAIYQHDVTIKERFEMEVENAKS